MKNILEKSFINSQLGTKLNCNVMYGFKQNKLLKYLGTKKQKML